MKLLVPILSKKESNPFFVKEILTLKPSEIFIISIIDAEKEISEFGFASTEIALANSIMRELEQELKNKKQVETILEWGETIQKIINTALLFKTKKVLIVENDLKETKKLVKELKKKKINVIKVKIIEPEPIQIQNNSLKEIVEEIKKTPETKTKQKLRKKSFLELIGLK